MNATLQTNDNPRLAEELSLSHLTDVDRAAGTPDPTRRDLVQLLDSGDLTRECCTFKFADGRIADRL